MQYKGAVQVLCGTSTVRYKGAVQVLCGTSVRYKYYTSNLTGPRAHNIIYFNSPPQLQGGCETNLRLSIKSRVRLLGRDLVKISAS